MGEAKFFKINTKNMNKCFDGSMYLIIRKTKIIENIYLELI